MRAVDGAIIAIDGPAGSGKSTVATELAARLGIGLVDTGAMYRTVALLAVERSVSLEDGGALGALAEEVDRGFRIELPAAGAIRVFLGDREVTSDIRRPDVSEAVSPVSAHREVRERMVGLQRSLAGRGGAVVEGRDIGTVVFPDASLKVYLEASAPERALRRHRELERKGLSVPLGRVEEEIRTRDMTDSSREHSPLCAAPDALVIDTSRLTVEQVTDEIVAALDSRGLLVE